MALLAVLAEQVLSRLLVVALSATYCRRSMYGLDMPHLLPFARKVLTAVVDRAGKSSIGPSLPYWLASGPFVFLSPGHGALDQTVPMIGAVLSWSDVHGPRCGCVNAQTWGSGQVSVETQPTGWGTRTVVVISGSLTHDRRVAALSHCTWNTGIRRPVPPIYRISPGRCRGGRRGRRP
jgi:hypothetical protein